MVMVMVMVVVGYFLFLDFGSFLFLSSRFLGKWLAVRSVLIVCCRILVIVAWSARILPVTRDPRPA